MIINNIPISYEEFKIKFGGLMLMDDGLPFRSYFPPSPNTVNHNIDKQIWTEYPDGHLENHIDYSRHTRFVLSNIPHLGNSLIVVKPQHDEEYDDGYESDIEAEVAGIFEEIDLDDDID